MKDKTSKIEAIPTNIITGFLGAGKTSAILHLLKSKPDTERWAVLVNEFGEIGVDGSLFQGQHSEHNGVFIREVPGGCMCCVAGLPMQIALNQLLTRARPHRLIIEPTGLGHPKEVLQTLMSDYNREVIALHKIITLVDARKLSDKRYTEYETFNQQIAIADVLVGNKLDLYHHSDINKIVTYKEKHAPSDAKLLFTKHGKIDFTELYGATNPKTLGTSQTHTHLHQAQQHTHDIEHLITEAPIPDSGFIQAENSGEGFHSKGWRFSANQIFHYDSLFSFLNGLHVERMKAVFITECGVFGYNLTSDALTEIELDDALESRIEIISREELLNLEDKLMHCIADEVTS